MNAISPADVTAMLPVAILVAGALVLLMTEVFLTSGRRGYMAGLTVVTALLAALAALATPPAGRVFGGMAVVDAFSSFVTVIVCGGLALSALVGAPWLHARGAERGEFYALALFATAGMSLLGSAADLLVAFISIEASTSSSAPSRRRCSSTARRSSTAPPARRSSRTSPAPPARSSSAAWAWWGRVSPSRSRRCPSTSGRLTSTRAPPPR